MYTAIDNGDGTYNLYVQQTGKDITGNSVSILVSVGNISPDTIKDYQARIDAVNAIGQQPEVPIFDSIGASLQANVPVS